MTAALHTCTHVHVKYARHCALFMCVHIHVCAVQEWEDVGGHRIYM